jgi:hypothetical protein
MLDTRDGPIRSRRPQGSIMFRLGLVATLSALILTGCVSTYAYRDGDGGDYYYSDPEIEYYGGYGYPYSTIGYGYPRGWHGSFGYGYGYGPYLYFPPHYWRPHPYHRQHDRHRYLHHHPPGVVVNPPGVIVHPPGGGQFRNRDYDREGGPWRNLDRIGGRNRASEPLRPGVMDNPPRTPVSVSQPARRMSTPSPAASTSPPRPRMESSPPSSAGRGRFEPRERELRRDTTP